MNEIDDAARGLAVVDADGDQPGLDGARRAQDVEPGAVAVIDLEAEAGGLLNHLGIVVDGGDVDALRQQALGDDLAEAAEADHQHRAARVGEIVGLAFGRPREAPQHRIGERGDQRAQQHGHGGNRGEDAGLARIEHAERAAERNEHEGELAGAGEHRSGAERVAAVRAGRAEQEPYDRRLEHGDDDGRGEDQPDDWRARRPGRCSCRCP